MLNQVVDLEAAFFNFLGVKFIITPIFSHRTLYVLGDLLYHTPAHRCSK